MTTAEQRHRDCPDAETLAMLADGRLDRASAEALMVHVSDCDQCTAAVGAASEVLRERGAAGATRSTWWLAAAAAAVIAVMLVAVFALMRRNEEPTARLMALVPKSARPTDGRLSGGFAWAPYRGPMRAEHRENDAARMKLIGAAGDLVDRASHDSSADAQRAAGVALVVIDDPQPAIDHLKAAVKAAPNDAAAWSDLAAAQLSAALLTGRPSLLPEALVSADHALRIRPTLPEALFNRAAIVERIGLADEARAAWRAYLAVDSTSAWANEARERLAALPAPGSASRDNGRAFAEVEQLGRWGEAFRGGDRVAAEKSLTAARSVADGLERTKGEELLRDAVRAIDDANDAQRAVLAAAHVAYRRGRLAYARQHLDEAQTELSRAATLFRDGGSPMALVARYYAANVRFDQNQAAAARDALEALLTEVRSQPRFIALAAQVRWELALCLMVDGDWGGALPLLEQSRDGFKRLDERQSAGFVESLIADTSISLGRRDEAWAARTRAFAMLSAGGGGNRLPVSLRSAATMELRSGHPEIARDFLELERSAARANRDPMMATDSLVRATLVDVELGDRDAAARTLRDATMTAKTIVDPSIAALARGHLQLATAATVLDADPRQARRVLTEAIETYGAANREVLLPESYLLRARAEIRLGDRNAAAGDLESGIAAVEQSRVRIGAIVGTGVLDAGVALFDDAIRLSADRGNVDQCFRTMERARGRLDVRPAGATEIQRRLAGSATGVIELASLPEELVAVCVTARDAQLERQPVTRSGIEALATLMSGGRTSTAADRLYDIAVRPFDRMLATTRHLIIVPDPRLDAVPFAALHDSSSGQYLVQRFSVSTAVTASDLDPSTRRTASSALVVSLPTGDAASLAESAGEVHDVAGLDARATVLDSSQATFAAFLRSAATAPLIHIVGHTEQRPGDLGLALPFADGHVSAGVIARQRLAGAPVVLLAACETLRGRWSPNIRTPTLGSAFLAAGATDVVGTLAPIADADARKLFGSIHRRVAAGETPEDAVRATQIEAIERHDPSWSVVALLTRRIAI